MLRTELDDFNGEIWDDYGVEVELKYGESQ
jgi:hypothetical protein